MAKKKLEIRKYKYAPFLYLRILNDLPLKISLREFRRRMTLFKPLSKEESKILLKELARLGLVEVNRRNIIKKWKGGMKK